MPRSSEIWIVGAKRTAFGTFGGALKDLTATDLAVEASRAALAHARVAPEDVNHVIFGNVQQTSADAIYHARHVGLRAGVPVGVPALTVNRLCGSGFQRLPRERTNVNGGAIALGHPLGASGARITPHLTYELLRRGGRLAVGAACIGGGQGIAVVLERV